MHQHRGDAQILHEDQILEAIDQLRRRKARPDADRICNYLLRKFSVDARDTIADLHRLIEAEKVIQVDYKGNTSYRNASKWSRLQLYKNRPEGFVKEKLNSSMIAGAVAELVVEEPDYLDQGVPAYRLIEQLLDGVSNPTSRRMVEDFLGKEVASGNIAKLSNGNYSLVPTSDMNMAADQSDASNLTNSVLPTTGNPSPTNLSNPRQNIIILDNFGPSNNANAENNSPNGPNDPIEVRDPEHNLNRNNRDSVNNNNNHCVNNSPINTPAPNTFSELISNENTGNTSNNNNNNNKRAGAEEEEEEERPERRISGIEIQRVFPGENGNAGKLSYLLGNPSTRSTGTGVSKEKFEAASDLYEFEENEDEVMVTDSRSNTPRSSSSQGNSSPSPINEARVRVSSREGSKEECYEITALGKEPDSPEESVTKEELAERSRRDILRSLDIVGRKNLEASRANCNNNNNEALSNLKRSSKAERKQRLLVRAEDPMDVEIKFDDFRAEAKDDESEKHHRDDGEHQSDEREDDDDVGRSSTNPSPTPSNTTVGAFRSARRKRAKKVFDPSDNNVVKRKRGRPVSQNKNLQSDSQDGNKPIVKDANRRCSLCAKDKSENLIACRDCTVRAHPTCIYTPEELHQKSGTKSWQCERCKTCSVCSETSDVGPLVTCYTCDEAFHYSCHVPRVSVSKSLAKWHCSECAQKHFKPSNAQNASRPETPSNTAVLPPVLSPQVSPTRASSEHMDDETNSRDTVDPNIPDASDWTSEQVYQYFARLFPKEAEVFRLQEIDGHSLLLMKRSDVLSGLDLLLGPALKIYRHVLKLQMRRDDPRLYWL